MKFRLAILSLIIGAALLLGLIFMGPTLVAVALTGVFGGLEALVKWDGTRDQEKKQERQFRFEAAAKRAKDPHATAQEREAAERQVASMQAENAGESERVDRLNAEYRIKDFDKQSKDAALSPPERARAAYCAEFITSSRALRTADLQELARLASDTGVSQGRRDAAYDKLALSRIAQRRMDAEAAMRSARTELQARIFDKQLSLDARNRIQDELLALEVKHEREDARLAGPLLSQPDCPLQRISEP